MMNVEVTGSFPVLDNDWLTGAFERASQYMLESILKNFEQGGRPVAWKPKKGGFAESGGVSGIPSFLGGPNGSIAQSMGKNFGNDYAEAGEITRFLPYVDIHNDGGTIDHPGSDKFQAFQIGGKWVFTHGTRPHEIPMPQREFILFQDEDYPEIDKIFKQYAVEYFDSHQQRIAQ